MAGENIIDNPREWGHHKSPFFKLPPEIRNKIYVETFEGSEVSLVIDPPENVAVVPVTGRCSIFNTASSNHQFLLTCYLVYHEALALYWTNTVVRNGCGGHFSRAYFLSRIPANAKPYIQHLRDVNAVATRTYRQLRGEVIRRSPSLALFFDEFPNLKTCLIKQWQPWSSSSVPTECNEAIARHPGIHLIDRRMTYEEVPEDPQNPRGPIRRLPSGFPLLVRQYVFTNRTNGAKVLWAQEGRIQWLSDETVVEMLMRPATIEPE